MPHYKSVHSKARTPAGAQTGSGGGHTGGGSGGGGGGPVNFYPAVMPVVVMLF